MNKTSQVEHIIFNYVVYGDLRRANIGFVVDLVLGRELELIRNKVCPYCNTGFVSKRALITHLRKSKKCYDVERVKFRRRKELREYLIQHPELLNKLNNPNKVRIEEITSREGI